MNKHTKSVETIDYQKLAKDLRIKSNMIAMGERIAWGSDSGIMDAAADAIDMLTLTPTPSKEVEEIVEELNDDFMAIIKEFAPNWYAHLVDSDENKGEAFRQKLTQTLQIERQKREEMVEAVRISEHPERLALWNEALEEGRRRERGHIQKVIDGHKVVYRTGDERFDEDAEDGDEKDHIDSCCNETIDEILQALTQPNNK